MNDKQPKGGAWTHSAFSALHDLSLELGSEATPATLADAVYQALSATLPGVPVAVWWRQCVQMDLLAGDPPTVFTILPDKTPQDLCLIHRGDAFQPSIFGYTNAPDWSFVPITDRSNLYGWIGLNIQEISEASGLLAFLCTAGALVGKTWQRACLERQRLEDVREKTNLRRYLSPTMADAIASGNEMERCVSGVTVLVLDLRQFTQRIYQQDHMELLAELNCYFSRAVEIVFRSDGVVDKLVGDGLIAEFGLLDAEQGKAADRALRSAQELVRMTDEFNRLDVPKLPFNINIGLATGEVHAGHVGGSGFYDLTVIGRAINLAARLEAKAKDFRVDILIDSETKERLGGTYPWREFSDIEIKGVPSPISVWGINASEVGGR